MIGISLGAAAREPLLLGRHLAVFVAIVSAILVGEVAIAIKRRRQFAAADADRQRELRRRRRTLLLAWGFAELCFGVAVLVGVGVRDVDRGPTRCVPSAVEPAIDECVRRDTMRSGAKLSAYALTLAIAAGAAGALAATRYRGTVATARHPDADYDDRPWHRRNESSHRMLLCCAGVAVAIAGGWLGPTTTSRFEQTSTTCTTQAFAGQEAQVCESHSIEVERVLRSGAWGATPLKVLGVTYTVAASTWWVWAVVLYRRRHERPLLPQITTTPPGYN